MGPREPAAKAMAVPAGSQGRKVGWVHHSLFCKVSRTCSSVLEIPPQDTIACSPSLFCPAPLTPPTQPNEYAWPALMVPSCFLLRTAESQDQQWRCWAARGRSCWNVLSNGCVVGEGGRSCWEILRWWRWLARAHVSCAELLRGQGKHWVVQCCHDEVEHLHEHIDTRREH